MAGAAREVVVDEAGAGVGVGFPLVAAAFSFETEEVTAVTEPVISYPKCNKVEKAYVPFFAGVSTGTGIGAFTAGVSSPLLASHSSFASSGGAGAASGSLSSHSSFSACGEEAAFCASELGRGGGAAWGVAGVLVVATLDAFAAGGPFFFLFPYTTRFGAGEASAA